MALVYVLVALVVALKVLDWRAAHKQPMWLVSARHFAAMTMLGLLVIFMLANWQGLRGAFSSLVSLVPIVFVALPLLRKHRIKRAALTAGVMFALAGAAFGLALSNVGTLLHGDAHPALKLASTAFGAGAIALITPPATLGTLIPDAQANKARLLPFALVLLAIVVWGGLSIQITTAARAAFPQGAAVCLRAPTGSQARHAFGIAPGDFRAIDWRGMTRPWLLAGTKSAGWTHHWSFYERSFVANETGAFTMFSPGSLSPTTPAC
ncbi:MAG: hypothetical protein ACRBCL_11885 [Maritimibacter sp.]